MNLPTEIFGDVIVVHTPEELSSNQAIDFEAYLPGLDRNRVVLDLDNTELFDSAGLTSLLNAHDRFRDEGGDVKIATGNATNRKLLEITRIDQQMEVFDSVVEAVKSFR